MENKILKRTYFVRHGSTVGNEANAYQVAETPLSETGQKQAFVVAERFKNINIEGIISSDYLRTRQTAEAISKATALPVETSELFRELRRPSDVLNKSKSDEYSKRVMKEISEHQNDPEWHHGDEENPFDCLKRARAALNFLQNAPKEKFVVVTHNIFIKMLMSAMACPDNDRRAVEMHQNLYRLMIGENTGITVADFKVYNNAPEWQLHIWNDHAHLG